jgi:hypothetical protein
MVSVPTAFATVLLSNGSVTSSFYQQTGWSPKALFIIIECLKNFPFLFSALRLDRTVYKCMYPNGVGDMISEE